MKEITFKPNQSPQMEVAANIGSTDYYEGRIQEVMVELDSIRDQPELYKARMVQIAQMAALCHIHTT